MAKGNGIIGKVSGSVGNLTFSIREGEQIMSGRVTKVRNPRTEAQVRQRIKFPNLVAMYRAFHGLLNECFERKRRNRYARAANNFNRFVSINLYSRPVFLTRSESAAGFCIAAPYQVSEGSLPSIETLGTGTDTYTDIALGELEITDETTVAQFSMAVVQNNSLYEYGDAIAYLSALQTVQVDTGTPQVISNLYKVTLDAANQELLRSVAPSFGFSVAGGYLGHGENIGQGAFAWIHSRRTSEGLQVSSQRLVVCNTLFQQYNNNTALEASTRAYGAIAVPIAPGTSGDVAQPAAPVVSVLSVAGQSHTTGNKTFAIAADDAIVMQGSGLDNGGTVQLVYDTSDEATSGHKTVTLTTTVRTNSRIESAVPADAAGYCFGFNVGGNSVARFIASEQNPDGDQGSNPLG